MGPGPFYPLDYDVSDEQAVMLIVALVVLMLVSGVLLIVEMRRR